MSQFCKMGAIMHEPIIACLKDCFGVEAVQFSPLSLGADIDASIYKAVAKDGSSYFVKLKHHFHSDVSPALVTFLYERGIEHLIPPLKTLQGQMTQPVDGFTLIVYPFIEGQDAFTHSLTDDQWIALGQIFRQVHTSKVPPPIEEKIRREAYSPKWREKVRSFYPLLEQEPRGDEVATNLLQFMKRHKSEIQQLVDTAEQLAQKISVQPPKFVLCHSDIHGGNVLATQSGKIYIVDWDEPIFAPKERDLMFIGAGVGGVWNDPREEELFYKGYGKTEIHRDILSYYRCERIVEDIAIYSQNLLLTAEGGDTRKIMYQHFLDMFAPRGVVAIALKNP